jgi:hypothetical protein
MRAPRFPALSLVAAFGPPSPAAKSMQSVKQAGDVKPAQTWNTRR